MVSVKNIDIMNLIYRSEHYCIVAYPVCEGIELFDKPGFRSVFLQGLEARRFQLNLDGLEREAGAVDALISRYCRAAARPIHVH